MKTTIENVYEVLKKELEQDNTGKIQFTLADVSVKGFQAICPECHQSYELDDTLQDKLKRMLELIMRLTALLPPPPTPITLILTPELMLSSCSKII